METNILFIALPILSGILGSYLTYYFTLKSKRTEAILKFKEEKYGNLLILLQGFVGNTASTKTKRAFFEEQYKSWLYCSDEVVTTVNEMVNSLLSEQFDVSNKQNNLDLVGNIVLAMRKDMVGKTKLSKKDFRYTSVLD